MPPRARLATPADTPALALLVQGLEVFGGEATATQSSATEARVAAVLAQSECAALLVAEEAGVLLGYALVFWQPQLFAAAETAYLSELFVAPEARGQGAGHVLVAAVVAAAEARGCRRVQLVAMKHRDSYRRGFYPRLGFIERQDAADFVLPLKE